MEGKREKLNAVDSLFKLTKDIDVFVSLGLLLGDSEVAPGVDSAAQLVAVDVQPEKGLIVLKCFAEAVKFLERQVIIGDVEVHQLKLGSLDEAAPK